MKILVTGATGFIGSWSAALLTQAGHEVRYLVRSREKLDRVLAPHGLIAEDVVCADVTDRHAVGLALQGCDAVIHTAAFVSTHKKDEQKVFNTNVGGTKNVIGQAVELGLSHIIHVSSVTAVYDPQAAALSGDLPPGKATSPYGHSKATCEKYVRDLQDKGAPVFISYPASVIGPLDPALTEPHVGISIFIRQVAMITSTGSQFVDVRDVARAHLTIIEQLKMPARVMIGGTFLSWAELAAKLDAVTGRSLRRAQLPGGVVRFLGWGMDVVSRITGAEMPVSLENAGYATRWVKTDDSFYLNELGLQFRDIDETLRETVTSLYQLGHLSAEQAGAAATR